MNASEVIVLGGGVFGAATAYELARSGARTTLVDAELDGRATSAGAGIVCPWTSRVEDEHWYRMARAGAERYPELLAELTELGAGDIGYRRVGALCPVEPGDRDRLMTRLRPRLEDANAHGAVTELEAGEATRLFPPLRPDLPAVHIPGAARVDGRLLRSALCQAAGALGTRIVRGTGKPRLTGDKVDGVTVDGEFHPCAKLVVAAGVWTQPLLAELGAPLPGSQQRGQILHLRLAGAPTGDWPVLLPEGGHYMVSFDDSRVVVGATREPGDWLELAATADGLAELLGFALGIAPGLGPATHIETRVGYRPMSPETLPQFGPVPGHPGVFHATGLGASGLTLGPYLGRELAELVLG
ncbi:NAD(P)/FAD-dependent oxidoreductase, partial [Sciscionella sediminilitoris]|uniref:NAD(P)/FAD-dependent oxidoreductase n=1 Tax=Sciscionella sediminilitoris TaxID=1445613 RepID=UPI0004DFCBAE